MDGGYEEKHEGCSRRWMEVRPLDSRLFLRTVARPSRVLHVSGAKSRGPPFHGPPGSPWSVLDISIFEIWKKLFKIAISVKISSLSSF